MVGRMIVLGGALLSFMCSTDADSVLESPNPDAQRQVATKLSLNSTAYGIVEVIHFVQADTPAIKFLRCGESIVGADFLDEEFKGQSVFRNFGILQTVAFKERTLSDKPLRVLQLGLGAGTTPTFLRQRGVIVDVVELNADVVEAAAKHFGYNAKTSGQGTTFIEDAIEFLARDATVEYDAVIHDLFTGYNPLQLLQVDIIQNIHDRWLQSNGVLLIDFFGYQHSGAELVNRRGHQLTMAIQGTLEHVFGEPPKVRCFREIDPKLYPDKPTNLVYMAWMHNPPSKNAAPFTVPPDPDFPAPMEGSSYWVQLHYHEFEVTSQLQSSSDGIVIDTNMAATSRIDAKMVRDYRELLVGFFPPAAKWFSEDDNTHDIGRTEL